MRKLISTLLALSMIISPLSVLAETKTTPVEAHIAEQWVVTLPTSIALGNSTSKGYSITVKGDVLDDTSITVTPDSSFTMTDLLNHSLDASVTPDVFKWTADMINITEGTTQSGNISLASLPAGTWSGNLNFTIAVKDIPDAGWYNATTGNLVYSWEELVSEGYITVTGDILKANASMNNLSDGKFVISDTIKVIADYGLQSYAMLSVVLPEGLTTIGAYAFSNDNRLDNIVIPSTVTSIGNQAFSDCYNFTEITIPSGVTSIGEYLFYSCSNLQTVTLPNTITIINQSAFSQCQSLAIINIPSSVRTIDICAFESCTSLLNLNVPSVVTTINDNAFYEVPNVNYTGSATGSPWGALSYNGVPVE